MDTPAKVFCGICDAQHITKTVDFWCPECDDGLCTECKSHHSFSKASRHHDVISIEDFKKLSADISNIVHHCMEHEKKLQMYCPHHNQLCCLLCISTSHKECTGMLPIEEIAKTCQSSDLQNHASDLQTFIGGKKLEEKIESEETYIQSLTEDGRLKQLSLKCTHNELIGNLLKNFTSFGLILLESSPQTVGIKFEKIKQAQIMSASVVKESVDDMNATFSGKFNISTGNMSTEPQDNAAAWAAYYAKFDNHTPYGQTQQQSQQSQPQAFQQPSKESQDNAAAWAAYYAKVYDHIPYVQLGGQTQQGQQTHQQEFQQPFADFNPQTGQPDYSNAYAE
ncbi:unnamed protein product [Mytilus coruscus]|uniref:B box-type domain-containing protein n=1 Tax=Mytilus coruscus TaxID=42192 RepID=A0A6J8ANB5_MYTCO|nr:unnamed protein product [Mytilus coruscus]